MILASTGGGARQGCRALRWEYLLSIRRCFLPSGSRHLLLRCPRSHLAKTRGSGHSRLSPWLVAPADASSCQQVLHSWSRQCIHGLKCGHSRQWVAWGSHPSCRGTSRGLSGGDHGHVAHCGWCSQSCRLARSLVRDRRALTPLANSKTASAVSHSGESLQPVQDTNHVRWWATHCRLRRPSHVRGDFLHV